MITSPGVSDDARFDEFTRQRKLVVDAREQFDHAKVVAEAEKLIPQLEEALMGPVGVNESRASHHLRGMRYEVLSYAADAAATLGRRTSGLSDWQSALQFLDAMRVGNPEIENKALERRKEEWKRDAFPSLQYNRSYSTALGRAFDESDSRRPLTLPYARHCNALEVARLLAGEIETDGLDASELGRRFQLKGQTVKTVYGRTYERPGQHFVAISAETSAPFLVIGTEDESQVIDLKSGCEIDEALAGRGVVFDVTGLTRADLVERVDLTLLADLSLS